MFDLNLYQQVWQRLNRSQIIAQIGNIPLMPVSVFNSLDSTNTKLWSLVESKIEIPCGAVALEQTAGKGQWGKSWVSSSGGLYLSVALNIDLKPENNPHLVMATAWGIAKVLRYYRLPVTIKWSNDLILEQRKLGGIKIETRSVNGRLTKAVVGVGINWCNPTPDMGISLKDYYQTQTQQYLESLEELTAIIAYGILQGYQYYLTVGIKQLLNEYLKICNSLGKQVVIDDCLAEVIGVTTDGKLRLRLINQKSEEIEIAIAPGQISLGY